MKVKIGYRTYPILKVNPEDTDSQKQLGTIEVAFEEGEKNAIYLRENLLDIEERETLLHEIIHGCLYEMGKFEHDEDLISGLSHILFYTIKSNPTVRKQIWD